LFFWRLLRPYGIDAWTRQDWIATSILWVVIAESCIMTLFIRHQRYSAGWKIQTTFFGAIVVLFGVFLQIRAIVSLLALLPQKVVGAAWNPWKWEPVAARSFAFAVCLVSIICGYVPPAIHHIDLHVKGLPADADGYTLCMLTDVHAGPITGRAELQSLSEEILKLDCDVVLFNGDIGEGFVDERKEAVEALLSLKDVPDGAYYTLGNHEYYNYRDGDGGRNSAREWAAWWTANGVRALNNTHVDLPLNGPKWFTLAGVDDNLGEPDIKAAVANRAHTGIPIVLAAHQPWPHADDAHAHGAAAVLSGHTHGGQFYPAQIMTSSAAGGYLSGHYETTGEVQLYVGDGTFGSEESRLRFFTRAEVTVVALKSSKVENGGGRGATAGLVFSWLMCATGVLSACVHSALLALNCFKPADTSDEMCDVERVEKE